MLKYVLKSIIVFLFGLVHGLGFASMLKSFKMSADNFLTTLISFNVGVVTILSFLSFNCHEHTAYMIFGRYHCWLVYDETQCSLLSEDSKGIDAGLATHAGKPIILHVRSNRQDKFSSLLYLLLLQFLSHNFSANQVFILHCFTGSFEIILGRYHCWLVYDETQCSLLFKDSKGIDAGLATHIFQAVVSM
jgi:hypothetical protein